MKCDVKVLEEEIKQLGDLADEDLKKKLVSVKSKQIKNLVKQLNNVAKVLQTLPADQRRKALQKYAKDIKYLSKAEIQNVLNSERKIKEITDLFNDKEFKDKPHLAAIEYIRQAADEVAIRKDDYVGSFITNLKKAEVFDYFTNPENGLKIHTELAHMADMSNPQSVTGDMQAFKTALEVRKLTNYIYEDAVDSGIPMMKIQNYAGPQNYDTDKIAKHDKEFVSDMMMWIDRNHPSYQHFDQEDFKQMLTDMKDKILFGEYNPELLTSEDFKVPSNIVNKLLKPRSIHLKPANIAAAYQKYGAKNFSSNIVDYATMMAKRSALAHKFTGNMDQGYQMVKDVMYSLADAKGKQKIAEVSQSMDNAYKYLTDFKFGGPGTSTIAHIGDTLKSLTAATTLNYGTTLTSALSDPMIGPAWLKSRMGASFLEAHGDFWKKFFGLIHKDKRRATAKLLGRVLDGDLLEWKSKFELEPKVKPGFVAKYTDKILGLTGMKHQFEISKITQTYLAATELAEMKDIGFKELNPYIKGTLERVGISPEDWDVLRKNTYDDDGIDIVSSMHIKANYAKIGLIQSKAIDLSRKVERFYRLMDRGVTAPGVMLQAETAAQPKDTISGQVWRAVQMYKGFGMSMVHTLRDINNYNPEDLSITISGKKLYQGHYKNLATAIVGLTTAGYATSIIKDIAHGKEPKNQVDAQVALRAFVNSGAIGPYADFILSDATLYGSSPEAVIAGPIFGKAGDAVQMLQKEVKDFYKGTNENRAINWFNYSTNNVPLANSPLVKPLLDYMIFNDIRNNLDPSYNIRKVRRMREEANFFGDQREFLFSPISDTLGLFK